MEEDTDELDADKLENPLIYNFVNKEFILKNYLKPEDDSDDSDEYDSSSDDETDKNISNTQINVTNEKKEKNVTNEIDLQIKQSIPDIRQDIFNLTEGIIIPPLLIEESYSFAKNIRDEYESNDEDNWVQKFMKNKHYSLVDNEGDGECLFATVRDAFSSIGQQTTVGKIRKKLSLEVDEKVFEDYKERYDMFRRILIEDTKKAKELVLEYESIKQKFSNTIDRNEQKNLSEMGKVIKEEHDNIVKQNQIAKEILGDYKFMKGIDDVDKLKKEMQKCSFWADTWAISTLERILNLKFIILSSENFKQGDINNVLVCGDSDALLKEQNIFHPEYYVIIDHTGKHYLNITYKKKMIFKFNEIPFDIKQLIMDKCMEGSGGLFNMIPDFQRFKSSVKKKNLIIEEEITYDDLKDSHLRGLYNEEIVFQFYSKSRPMLPGKGAGEKINDKELINFKELSTISDWRKKLSNFWVEKDKDGNIIPIVIDNHKWASVEHYYQASKFKENNPEFYLSFSLDSNTDLSKDPLLAKAAGGKTGKFKKELIRPKQVEIDPNFFRKRHKEEMAKAQMAKFSQIQSLKQLLLATKNAKLTHYSRGQPPIVFNELMVIRNKLKKE